MIFDLFLWYLVKYLFLILFVTFFNKFVCYFVVIVYESKFLIFCVIIHINDFNSNLLWPIFIILAILADSAVSLISFQVYLVTFLVMFIGLSISYIYDGCSHLILPILSNILQFKC